MLQIIVYKILHMNIILSELLFTEFKYLGTTLTNQNSIVREIKSRLRSGNACYHSVQNLLAFRLLSQNLKIKISRTIILLLFCMGVKLGC